LLDSVTVGKPIRNSASLTGVFLAGVLLAALSPERALRVIIGPAGTGPTQGGR